MVSFMKLKELFPNVDIGNMELKELMRNIGIENLEKMIENEKNYEDSRLYVEFQEALVREKQKELIEKGVF